MKSHLNVVGGEKANIECEGDPFYLNLAANEYVYALTLG